MANWAMLTRKGLSLTLPFFLASFLGGCPKAQKEVPVNNDATLTIDLSKLPKMPRFDAAQLDNTVSPCVDLNRHVSSKWLKENPVPSDKTSWGSFEMLQERTLGVQKQIVEAAAAAKTKPGTNEQKIGDIFAAGMNEKKLNEDGVAPLKPYLAEIDALKNADEISSYLIRSFAKGQQFVFNFGPLADFKNAKRMIAFAFQGGLSLPEKTYYSDVKYKDKRDAFVAHVQRTLELVGVEKLDAAKQAQAVLAFETRLAEASLSPVELRLPENQYNFVSIKDAEKLTPNFMWSKLFAAQGITPVDGFSLSQPKFFVRMSQMLSEVSPQDWKSYLRYQTVVASAPFLSDSISNERFAFHGTTMRGQKEQKPRWKRVLDTVNGVVGEALGEVYVKQVFPESSKVQMLQLVKNLSDALKNRLEKLEWMSAQTKAKALEKWKTFTPKIGYPDKWRDYSGLTIDANKSYLDNVMVAGAFENAYQMKKVGKPTDRTEWGMTPQTVNAYYNPLQNEIVFPAAILQPPFFDPKADPALNYGGIGAVIGHEMVHGYDDQGSKFDAEGNNNNWWTKEDLAAFEKRTDRLVAQFDAYTAVEDVKEGKLNVNGKLTLGENIADLGGLTVAYDALQKALASQKVEKIDGFTQEQRFFMNWATVWRRNFTPDELKVRLNTDPHAPANFRANGAPSNMASFEEAFPCKDENKMARPQKDRVVIW